MKIFLAYPFTQLLNEETGLVDLKNTDFLKNTVNDLKESGYNVFSAQHREAFGHELMDPDTATHLDFDEMKNTDLVVAFPGQFPISGGVHVELGWASALGKTIIIFLHEDQMYTPMVDGLHTITKVKYIKFNNLETNDDLTQKILQEVNLHFSSVTNV